MFSDEIQNPLSAKKEEFGVGTSVCVQNANTAVVQGAKCLVRVSTDEVVFQIKKKKYIKICGSSLVVEEVFSKNVKVYGNIKSIDFEGEQ